LENTRKASLFGRCIATHAKVIKQIDESVYPKGNISWHITGNYFLTQMAPIQGYLKNGEVPMLLSYIMALLFFTNLICMYLFLLYHNMQALDVALSSQMASLTERLK